MNDSLTPQSRDRVVVSIINYRTADLTIQCIGSVLEDLPKPGGHVVVVDNNSGDGSADKLAEWIDGLPDPSLVTLVRSPRNTGFSGGHNQGMGARESEFYLVLNSDAVIKRGFFRHILKRAESSPDIGLFAPRIDYDDGQQQISCFRFPSPASELIRGARSGPVTRALDRWKVPLTMPPTPADIQWASFACILLRGTMVRGLGEMDEGYFLYFEDVEYCWRARRANWGIAYVPEARAVHFRGGSGPVKALAQARKRLPPYYYASRTRLFRQLYGPSGPLRANVAWLAGRGMAKARSVMGKDVPPGTEGEFRDIWTNALSPLGDRRAVEG